MKNAVLVLLRVIKSYYRLFVCMKKTLTVLVTSFRFDQNILNY